MIHIYTSTAKSDLYDLSISLVLELTSVCCCAQFIYFLWSIILLYYLLINLLLNLVSTEGVWYPKEKIRQAKKKLLGYNPAYVMLTELTLGHEKTTEFPALKKILLGDKVYNKRAQVGLL